MFASQLLKILQALPRDVEKKTCAYHVAEQDMTMKENEIGTNFDSKSFENKEKYQLDGSLQRDTNPIVFEVKGKDGYWNPFMEDISMDNQNGTIDSAIKQHQNELSYHPISLEEDADSLFKETNYQDELQRQNSADHECSVIVDEFTHRNESGPLDSDIHLCNDDNNNNVLEPPIVCYKEINYHVVKDICVDAGDKELFISDGLGASSLENEKGVSNSESEIKEEICEEYSKGSPNLSPNSSFDEDSMERNETNVVSNGKSVSDDAPEEASLVASPLPIQDFGTRSFLRSFLNNVDSEEENKIQQRPDQLTSGKVVSENLAASSVEAGPKEDQCGKVYETSIKVNDDFSNTETTDENIHDQSPEPTKENSDNLSSDGQLHISSSKNPTPINSENLEKYDPGESSFSAAGFINYSEPIAFSGSISLRSDGSATSGRSFAFPVLQNEWNSSPVRMSKPDGKHFRKHKGWRSGLLCCRF